MLQNILKIAIRHIKKYKAYAAINVIGLSLAMACSLLIFLFIYQEMTYDTFHERGDNIYRMTRVDLNADGSVRRLRGAHPMPVGPALVEEIAGIETAVRFTRTSAWVRANDININEPILFADPTFFDVFTFPMIQGRPLLNQASVVVTPAFAIKYFGDQNPIGQTLSVKLEDAYQDYIVAGVTQPIPEHSSIQFEILMSYGILEALADYSDSVNNWYSNNSSLFVLLHNNVQTSEMPSLLAQFAEKHWSESPRGLRLQPLRDIHLDTSIGATLEPTSDPTYSYILGGIGLFVIGIACINFMNLTIGQAATRFREVAMRKVLGADKQQLIKQFWSEALLFSFVSLLCGFALARLFLPVFNELAGKNLSPDLLGNWPILVASLGLMAIMGIMAGSYPALVMANLETINTLKGKFRFSGTSFMGKSLIVLQFTLSIFLIIGTLFMGQQLDYLRNRHLGYNQEQVVVIPINEAKNREQIIRLYKDTFRNDEEVLGVAATSNVFSKGWSRMTFQPPGAEQNILTYTYKVDEDYLNTMQMTLQAGRDFSSNMVTDATHGVLINEKLQRALGWDNAVGKILPVENLGRPTVLGVVADFHNLSLHEEIPALVLHMLPENDGYYNILVRLAPNNIASGINRLQSTWETVVSDVPFTFSFLDESVARQYADDERWGVIVRYAASIAIVIACLGLFGLTALAVNRRTREIGIRKVLGASMADIMVLNTRGFLGLVLIANILAWPLAYYAMNWWLESFSYRTDLSVELFLLAALITLAIAMATVSAQGIKAVRTNPVDSLRSE